jgi:hypothetical protein
MMMRVRTWWFGSRRVLSVCVLCVILLVLPTGGEAQSAKPKLPPGRDPGGPLIGLITAGIDPTRPEVLRCLARDGEGELLGWDMVDRDRRPFAAFDAARARDTVLFDDLVCGGRVRIAPVRVASEDGMTLAMALAFFSVTPARVVVVPATSRPRDWEPFRSAAAQFSGLLILVAAEGSPGQPGQPTPPSGLGGNVVLSPAETLMAAAVRALSCAGAGRAGTLPAGTLNGAQLAARLDQPECR